ncbi:hypothetical protein AW736_07475 [Termitidicoccus mucosus]|uniref:Autotransporter domain-containing protein n=1 Tax=Termitidicoccus mucosus TaxID=1184151 RepID=A0A178IL80_9BACT|nr:hypothetical protein AW736_07475 [Opitutaceae bacterium TSB47]
MAGSGGSATDAGATSGDPGNAGTAAGGGASGVGGAMGGITLQNLELSTAGSQTYDSNVAISGSVALATGATGTIAFAGNVAPGAGPAPSLTIAGAREISFGGALGNSGGTGFESISVTGSLVKLGGNTAFTTTGDQLWSGSLQFTGNSFTARAGGDLVFDGGINNTGLALTLDGDAVTLLRDLNIASVAVTGTNGIAVSGVSITTANAQTYNQSVTLAGDVTFASTVGGITFAAGIVNPGAGDLAIKSNGSIQLGGGASLADGDISLTATTGNIVSNAQITAVGGSFSATAATGAITLGGVLTGSSQTYAARSFTGTGLLQTLDAGAGIAINATAGNITLSGVGGIDSAGAFSATASGAFNAATAANTITAAGNIGVTAGSMTLGAEVRSTGGDIALRSDSGNIALSGGSLIDAAGVFSATSYGAFATATAANTIDAGGNISITARGNVSLAGDITSDAGGIALTSSNGGVSFVNATSLLGAQTHTARNGGITYTGTASGASVAFDTGGLLTLGALISGTDISITAGSLNITNLLQTANAAAGDITLNATAGDITLSSGGRIDAAGTFTATTSGNFTTGGAGNTITAGGDVSLFANAHIILNGAVTAAGGVALENLLGHITLNAPLTARGGDIGITSERGLITAGAAVSATAGAVTMTNREGNIIVGDVASGSAQAYHAGNNFTGTGLLRTTASGEGITIETGGLVEGGIAFTGNGAVDSSGAFSATAAGGFATAGAANTITAAGPVGIRADGSGGIALAGAVTSAGDSILLTAANGGIIASSSLTAAGALTAVSGSALTVGAVTTAGSQSYTYYGAFTATSGTLRTTGAGSGIGLRQMVKATNDAYTGDIAIKDADTAGAFSATGGRFTLLTGGTLRAGGDVAISNPVPSGYTYADSWFTAIDGDIVSTGGGVRLVSGRGVLNLNGSITSRGAQYYESWKTAATGTFVTTDPGTGDISFNYNGSWAGPSLDFAATTRVDAARDLLITYPSSSSGTITLPAGAYFRGGNSIKLHIPAVSAIRLLADLVAGDGGIDLSSNGSLTLANVTTTGTQSFRAGGITLTGTLGGTGDILLRASAGNITFAGPDAIVSTGGNFTGSTVGNFLTGNAANTIAADGGISIFAAAMSLRGAVTSTAGDIALTAAAGDISVAAQLTAAAGSLTATAANGAITVGDVQTGAGQTYAAAGFTGTGLLKTTGAGAGIAINATNGNILLSGTGTVDSAGAFSATAAGNFTTAGAANTIATAGAVSIRADGFGAGITLNGALASATGGVTLRAAGSLTANAPITSSLTGTDGVSLTAADGMLRISDVASGGAQDYYGWFGVIVGGSLKTLDAGAGDIALAAGSGDLAISGSGLVDSAAGLTAHADVGSLVTAGSANTLSAAGDITLASGNDIELNAAVVSATGNIELDAATGNILANARLTAAGSLSATAANGSITVGDVLTGSSQTHAAVGFTGTGLLKTTGADADVLIDVTGAAQFSGSGRVESARDIGIAAGSLLTAGTLNTLTAWRDIVLGADGDITLRGDLAAASGGSGGITATATNGSLDAGPIAATSDGDQSYAAGGDLVLPGDIVTGTGGLTASAGGDLTLRNITGGKSLGFSGSNIFVTGTLKTTTVAGDVTLAASHSIAFLDTGSGAGALDAAGAFTADSGWFSTGSAANTLAAAGAIAITATLGDIMLNGAVANTDGGIALTSRAGDIFATAQLTSANAGLAATATAGAVTLAGVQTRTAQRYTGASFTGTGLLKTTDAATGDIVFDITNGATLSGADGRIDAAGKLTADVGAFATAGTANTVTTGRDIAITATTGDIIFNGAVTSATGGIVLAATLGDILSTAQLTVAAGNLAATATAGAITIGGVQTSGAQNYTAANFTGTGLLKTTDAATGDIMFNVTNAARLDGVDGRIDAAGRLTAVAGSFTTAGMANTITTGDAIALTATTGDITLHGAVANTDGGIALTSLAGNILATAQLTSANAGLAATATAGAVTLAGVQTRTAQRYTGASFTGTGLLKTTDAATGDIVFDITNGATLSGADGRIDAAGKLTADVGAFATAGTANTVTTGRDIAITATTGDIIFNGAVTSATGGIVLAATLGDILSTAQLTVDAGNLAATATAGAVTVGGVQTSGAQNYTAANFTGTGLLQTTTAATGDIVFEITNDAQLSGADGRVESARGLTVTAGSFTTAGTANTLAAGQAVALTAATGGIALNGAVANIAGGITLAALNGDILSTAQITSVNAGLTATATAGAIALAGAQTRTAQTYTGASFTGTGLLKTTDAATGDIAFNITDVAILSGADGRIDSARGLTFTAGSLVTDGAANTLTAARAIALTAATGGITLNGAVVNAAGDITLTAADGVFATAAISAANGSVDVWAKGAAGIALVNVASSGSQHLVADTGGIAVTGLLDAGGDLVISATAGAVEFSGGGVIDARGLFTAGALSFATAGTANTIAAGQSAVITASSGDITLNGALVSGSGGIALATTAGGGVALTARVSADAGMVDIGTTGTGGISVVDVSSAGRQNYVTTGGDITVSGLLRPATAGAGIVFSTTTAGIAGMTTIKSGAAVELSNAELLVRGGFTLEAGGGVRAQNGVFIDAAGREVILGALLGGASGVLDTINIAGAGSIGTVGIETTGTQFLGTEGGDIEVTGLLKSAASGAAIQFMTAGAGDATVGMATVRSGGGIEVANGSLDVIGGLTMETGATLRVGGADGVDIDGRGRAAAFHIALGGAGNELSKIRIRNAGDILLSGVTTTGDQFYHFDDGAAMRLDGALIATGTGSITITNDRVTHADWATIFSTAPGGIHIETVSGDIHVSEFNTMLSFDNGQPDLAAGDIFIKSTQGAVAVSNMIASHKIELTASPVNGKGLTLLGTHYQAGTMYCYAIYNGEQAFIPTASFFVPNNPTLIITGKNEARMPWLTQIRLHAYLDGAFSEATGRVVPELFSLVSADLTPWDSIFHGGLYYGSTYPGWLIASADAIQNTVASNPYERALELAALEENMQAALASFMSDTDTANRISGATRDELVSVGIFSRRPTAGEHLSRTHYRGLFQQIIQSEDRTPEMFLVVDGRISEANARTAVELYHNTFMRRGDDGSLVSRVPEIQAALQACIRVFRAENSGADPSEFAGYVRGRAAGNADAALVCEFIDGTRRLFGHISGIGLTRNEIAAAKSVLIRPLRAPGLPAGAIRDLIEPPATATARAPLPGQPVILSQNVTAY